MNSLLTPPNKPSGHFMDVQASSLPDPLLVQIDADRNAELRAGPLSILSDRLPDVPPAPNYKTAFESMARTDNPVVTLVHAIANGQIDSTFDPDFDLVDTIRKLAPREQAIAWTGLERGHFDTTVNAGQFRYNLWSAEMALLDEQRVGEYIGGFQSKLGKAFGFASLLPAGLLNPTNLIPVLSSARFASRLSLAQRLAFNSATFGGTALATKLAMDRLDPITNQPGISDELAALGSGAALGGGGTLAFAAARRALTGAQGAAGHLVASPWFSRLEGTGLASALRKFSLPHIERINAAIDDAMFLKVEASGINAGRPILRVDSEGALSPSKLTISDLYKDGESTLRRYLADADAGQFEPNLSVSFITESGNDVNSRLFGRLKTQYDARREATGDTDIALHFVEHPDQGWIDSAIGLRRYEDTAKNIATATGEDFGYGFITRFLQKGERAAVDLGKAVGGRTPGVRAGDSPSAHIRMMNRALFGESTIERAAAQEPELVDSIVAANGFARQIEGWTVEAQHATDKMARAARGEGISWRGEPLTSGADFRAAAIDYIRAHAEAEQLGRTVAPEIANAHPRIREIAQVIHDGYFRRVADELEAAGLLDKAKTRKWYAPRMYDIAKIRQAPDAFEAGLVRGLREFDHATLGADGLRPEAIERLMRPSKSNPESQRIRDALDSAWFDAGHPFSTEGDVVHVGDGSSITAEQFAKVLSIDDLRDAGILDAYRGHLDRLFRETAKNVREKLTVTDDLTGAPDLDRSAFKARPLEARALEIAEHHIGDYLIRDAVALMDRYGHAVKGELAIARTIKANPKTIGQQQVFRDFDGTRVRTGRPVESARDLQWLHDDFVRDFKGKHDLIRARAQGADLKQLDAEYARILGDSQALQTLLRRFRGRGVEGQDTAFASVGRTIGSLTTATRMGSSLLSQFPDAALPVVHMMSDPRQVARMGAMTRIVGQADAEQLKFIGMVSEGMRSASLITDLPARDSGHGWGVGRTRVISGGAERGARKMADATLRVGGMAAWTSGIKHIGAEMLQFEVVRDSKRMLAGTLGRYEAARLNRIGLNSEYAQTMLGQLWEHGTLPDGAPLKSAFASADDFAKSSIDAVHVNMALWDETPDVRLVRERLVSGINDEIHHHWVPTPKASDQYQWVEKSVLGKLFHQFWTYTVAFANQRIAPMTQMPFRLQLPVVGVTLALGYAGVIAGNLITGSRTVSDILGSLRENPAGEFYAAFSRSGMLGAFTRPFSYLDAMKIGPGFALGSPDVGGVAGHAQKMRQVGPADALAAMSGAGIETSMQLATFLLNLNKDDDKWSSYRRARMMPWQNLIWFRLLNRMTDIPRELYERTGIALPSDVAKPPR